MQRSFGKALAGLPAQSHSKPRSSYTKDRGYKQLAVRSKSCLKTEVERVTRALGRPWSTSSDEIQVPLSISCDGFLVRLAENCGYGRKRMSVKYESAQWWMPRHEPAMKDVASCDKPRGAASKLRSGDVRMGKPNGGHTPLPEREPTQGTDTSKYLVEKKSTEILQVAASERGTAQTGGRNPAGVVGPYGINAKA